MFAGCDVSLQAEGKHFQHLLSIGQVKNQHLKQNVELNVWTPTRGKLEERLCLLAYQHDERST